MKDFEKVFLGEDRIDVWISGFQANLSLMLLIPFLLTKNPEWAESRIFIRMIVPDDVRRKAAEENLRAILRTGRIEAGIDVVSLGQDPGAGGESPRSASGRGLFRKRGMAAVFSRLLAFFSGWEAGRVPDSQKNRVREIICATSASARLVVMGMKVPAKGQEAAYAREMKNLLQNLPQVVLVKGNYNISLFL